ncbi:PHD finger protein 20-like protein 1 [Saccostrea echinata]|uniref:PHD finger protein 20-like protein 1 n=1 Tax=Saccostrea echinata TaxID=191078 RepID=UPI002A8151B3|nr:PHD finger protein 20-like protein 1 [Saccostrea echinata]
METGSPTTEELEQNTESTSNIDMTDKLEKGSSLPLSSDSTSRSRVDADDISTCSSASSTTQTPPVVSKKFPVRPGISWRKGERLEAMDFSSKWYQAKIVEIDEEEKMVMIHFDGWNQRYDEWIEMDSEKLRPKTRHSSRKGRAKQSEFKLGDHVYAKWTDCKMYPGKVTAVLSDGSYDILFYDGFKKTVQGINIKAMPKELQQQKIEIVHVLPKDERKRSMEEEIATLPKKRRSSSIYSRREGSLDKAPRDVESTRKVTERTRSTISDDDKRRPSKERRQRKGDKKLIIAGSLFKKRDRSTSSERSKTGSCSSKELTTDETMDSTGSAMEQPESTGGLMEQPPTEDSGVTPPAEQMMADVSVPESTDSEVSSVIKKSTDTPVTQSTPSLSAPPSSDPSTQATPPTGTPLPGPGSPEVPVGAPVPASAPSTPAPGLMSAPSTPMATPLSSMPPSPASTLSAVSSSPSTPKQSPSMKTDGTHSAGAGPSLELPTSIHPPKGKKDRKSRKQTFSPITQSGESSARKRSKSTEKGEKSDQPHSSRKRSRSTNERANYILVPETALPPKAFVIEPEHNHYKCTFENCNKGFRKESLLESHIKFYHSNDGKPPQNPPRKRRKTSSICSTDSDISITPRQRYPSSGSLCRPSTSHEGTTEVTGTDSLSAESQPLYEGLKSGERARSIGQDVMIAEESMETEYEDTLSKDEVVNCICRFNEENGLMIQCDVCLCWQHATCFDITESTLPKKYICYVCENPPGIRDSRLYVHDQDWLKLGHMAHFGFLPNQEEDESCCRTVQATHGLVGDLHNVSAVIHGLKQKLKTVRKKDRRDPMLQMWLQNLDNVQFDPIDPDVDSESEEIIMDISTDQNKKTEAQDQNPELGSGTHQKPQKGEVSDSACVSFNTEKEQQVSTELQETSDKREELESATDKTVGDLSQAGRGTTAQDGGLDKNIVKSNHEIISKEEDTSVKQESTGEKSETCKPESESDTASIITSNTDKTEVKASGSNTGNGEVSLAESGEGKKNQMDQSNYTLIPAEQSQSLHGESCVDQSVRSEVKVEDVCDLLNSVDVVKEDPFKLCERNLLEHILRVQTEIEQRLDHIEEQVCALEAADSNFSSGPSDRDLLSDVPALKKTLYLLQHDLVRVQRMAAYHR